MTLFCENGDKSNHLKHSGNYMNHLTLTFTQRYYIFTCYVLLS
jgi:hypothetical protein